MIRVPEGKSEVGSEDRKANRTRIGLISPTLIIVSLSRSVMEILVIARATGMAKSMLKRMSDIILTDSVGRKLYPHFTLFLLMTWEMSSACYLSSWHLGSMPS